MGGIKGVGSGDLGGHGVVRDGCAGLGLWKD